MDDNLKDLAAVILALRYSEMNDFAQAISDMLSDRDIEANELAYVFHLWADNFESATARNVEAA